MPHRPLFWKCAAVFCFLLPALFVACASRTAWAQFLYASSEQENRVYAIDTGTGAGTVLIDNTSGFLASPEGLAFYAPTGDLFIANAGSAGVGANGSIVQYNVFTGATSVFYTGNAGLNSPQGLTFDTAGNLYATGYNSGTIVQFARTGGALSSTATTYATGLTNPYYLAFDQAGGLFVANTNNSEIRRYSAPETFTIFESGATTGVGTLDGPVGLAFKDTTLFTSDALNNTIAGFNNASGDTSTRANSDLLFAPMGDAALNFPQAITYDSGRDQLYVANYGNNNIVSVDATTGAANVLYTGSSPLFTPTGLVLATPEPPTGLLALCGAGGASGASLLLRRRRTVKKTP